MTQEEILDYNERCLKILPFKYKNQSKYWVIYKYDDNSFFGRNRRDLAVNNLKFHSDWNWIMEVVEAIEKLKFRFEIWKLEDANLHRVDILKMGWDSTSVFDAKDGWSKLTYPSKKEAVVEAINQFLIWYNNEHKN